MKATHAPSLLLTTLIVALTLTSAHAQNVPASITTPDRVETRLGTLNFKDGVPDTATAQKLFDELDYVHAVEAFINGYAGRQPTRASQGIHRRRHQRQRRLSRLPD